MHALIDPFLQASHCLVVVPGCRVQVRERESVCVLEEGLFLVTKTVMIVLLKNIKRLLRLRPTCSFLVGRCQRVNLAAIFIHRFLNDTPLIKCTVTYTYTMTVCLASARRAQDHLGCVRVH